MNRISIYFILCLLVTSFTAGRGRAAETNAASRFEYPAFRIIEERNIFNPNRSKGSSRTGDTPSRRERSNSRTEFFALRGTMSYEKGRFAFFEGSNSDYRKALEVDGKIAGYNVAEIGTDYVKLESNGTGLSLRVGMQMKKREGEWALADASEPIESSSAPESSSKTEGTETAEKSDSAASAGGNDVLKRLLQKREQELNNEGAKDKTQPESIPK